MTSHGLEVTSHGLELLRAKFQFILALELSHMVLTFNHVLFMSTLNLLSSPGLDCMMSRIQGFRLLPI